MPLIQRCLSALLAQDSPFPFEVIVIDSQSSDGTWEWLETLPIVRARISPQEFGHGKTRNLGASLAKGQFLVFLVQDAVPVERTWLMRLVEAARLDSVAGSYGRQIAHPDSHALTRHTMERAQSNLRTRVVRRLPSAAAYASLNPKEQLELTAFTDVCSCIHKDVWLQFPFADVPYGEDMEWAQRVLKAGYAIAYEPNAAVYHSHERSAWYEFKRAYADHHLVHKLFGLTMIASPWRAIRAMAWATQDAWRYVLASHDKPTTKARLLVWAPLLVMAQVLGQYFGARAERLKLRFRWFRRLDSTLRYGV